MSLKKFLLLPLSISLGIFVYFSDEVITSLEILIHALELNRTLVFALLVAVLLQIAGHIIRAYKMRFLLAPVKASTVRFQFRALSLGYLFNALLPFRLGELVRTQIIAGAERISFGFALTLVIIERAIDAAFLALLGLLLVWIGVASGAVVKYILLLMAVSILAMIALLLLGHENQRFLRLWYRTTSIFSDSIAKSLRFKMWTLIYGLQRIATRKRAVQYIGLTFVSWLFYLSSVFIVVQVFLPNNLFSQQSAATLSPYYGISLPAGPANLGTYSNVTNDVTEKVAFSAEHRVAFDLTAWALLLGPVSLLGIVFLFTKTKESLWRRLPKGSSSDAMAEKLFRTEDFSHELDSFLDNYFSGNSLSQIVHRLELRHDFRLLKYFKGGSDAITILVLQGNETVVKKIIAADLAPRLRAQYDWLKRRAKNKGIVRAIRDHEDKKFYAIDLEYDKHNEMFFDFIHSNSLEASQQIMKTVWSDLAKSLYTNTEIVTDRQALDQYISTHIFGCLDKATAVNEDLVLALQPKRIKINGKSYHNLHQVMNKIMKSRQIMRDLSTYKRSQEVHGDVAVDNILVSRKTGKSLLIDPAPDGNIINGPVFDFSKNMQSLYCGYEFLFRSNETVSLAADGSIRYQDSKSVQYNQLCDYVRAELAPQYLSEVEQRAMLFHAGALHIRRLKHQVYQNPANVLAIYAVGVKTLNDFLAQYEKR